MYLAVNYHDVCNLLNSSAIEKDTHEGSQTHTAKANTATCQQWLNLGGGITIPYSQLSNNIMLKKIFK